MKLARQLITGYVFLLGLLPAAGRAQSVSIIKFPELQKLLAQSSDSVLVVSFWATWCAPCVAELPYFDQLSRQHAAQKVKVVLVNLDGVSQLEKRVRPFLAKKRITSAKVLSFDEANNTHWINQVSPDWSGALPFTLMISPHQKRRKTFERSFSQGELAAEIQLFIQ